MTTQLTRPVPLWEGLPAYVHSGLTSKGVAKQGFDSLNPEYRLSVLNLFVKLRGINILGQPGWGFVRNVTRVDVGVLDFIPHDIDTLRNALTGEPTFADPWGDDWQSRELRLSYSAHFRHHKDWGKMVSVHIDPVGLFAGPGAIRKPEAVIFGLPHLICYYHYQRVEDIRGGLLGQGWDPQPLLGVGVWHCGARDCPTHSRPEHRCQDGVWFCGRRQPQCSGHSSPSHSCASGRTWHCGARNCLTHSQPEHRCQGGVWFCGRRLPLCPGHSGQDHRCEAGAALLYFDRTS